MTIAQEPVNVVPGQWPMWPEPSKQILSLNIKEPATFLSIGREVTPWPFFQELTTVDASGNVNLLGADLYFTIEKFTNETVDGLTIRNITGYATVNPGVSASDDLFMVPGNSTLLADSSVNSDLVNALGSEAVFPDHVANWITYVVSSDVIEVANESFQAGLEEDPDKYLDAWKVFLVEDRNIGTEEYFFADSGHAPPQMIWPYDPWLYAYRAKTGYEAGPVAWEGRYVCFWPTNQGALQAFEVYNVDVPGSTPYATRKWLAVPNPAFRQSIYHELRNFYGAGYKRFTLLDGPVMVRDVEIGGEWKRIAVGTTGMGTKQIPKPQNAWTVLGQSGYDPATAVPSVVNKGGVFGVYVFDITDLEETATTETLKPLWSVSNSFYQTSAVTYADYFPEKGTETAKTGYAAYGSMKFSVSKPLIGYTRDANGNRTWHVIILGIEKATNKYMWLDVKPEDGSVRDSGYFRNLGTNLDETLTAVTGIYTAEQVENLFPSRILSAFPPKDEREYEEPLLSDIYVYLSNGGIYRWDLNEQDSVPGWIATLTNFDNQPTTPMTDFDISYVDGDTFLAANVALTFQGGSDHETEGLIILNLTKMPMEDRKIKVPPGQAGDIFTSPDDFLLVLQLQLDQGAYVPGSKTVLASPVFIYKKLYLAFYELDTKGKTSEISRLYSFLFGSKMGTGNRVALEEDVDYQDLGDVEAAMILIDSLGRLVLLDASGNVLQTLDTGLDPQGSGTGGGFTGSGVTTVYWKIKE